MNTNLTMSSTDAALAGGIVGGIFASVVIFAFVVYILQIIAWWKVFEKAGEKGWKSLIPFYNLYIAFRIVGMKNWFWCVLGLGVVAGIVSSATGFDTNNVKFDSLEGAALVGAIVYCVTGIIAIIIQIVQCVRLSKAFGHGIGFALGLIFFGPIFLMILGFGKSKYDKKVVKAWEK